MKTCFRTILKIVVEHYGCVIHHFIHLLSVLSFARREVMIKTHFPVEGQFLLRFVFPKLLCSVEKKTKRNSH